MVPAKTAGLGKYTVHGQRREQQFYLGWAQVQAVMILWAGSGAREHGLRPRARMMFNSESMENNRKVA